MSGCGNLWSTIVTAEGRIELTKLKIRTRARCEMLDVTGQVAQVVRESGVQQGAVVVYVPHTTAGCTINENADPDVQHDLLLTLNQLVPKENPSYRHSEGNSDGHVKASLVGVSETILIEDGRLVLGTWQGIYFCEFDGPRQRTLYVRVAGETAN
jgi:secondary thiamine-phosphate synthase enzyme